MATAQAASPGQPSPGWRAGAWLGQRTRRGPRPSWVLRGRLAPTPRETESHVAQVARPGGTLPTGRAHGRAGPGAPASARTPRGHPRPTSSLWEEDTPPGAPRCLLSADRKSPLGHFTHCILNNVKKRSGGTGDTPPGTREDAGPSPPGWPSRGQCQPTPSATGGQARSPARGRPRPPRGPWSACVSLVFGGG